MIARQERDAQSGVHISSSGSSDGGDDDADTSTAAGSRAVPYPEWLSILAHKYTMCVCVLHFLLYFVGAVIVASPLAS